MLSLLVNEKNSFNYVLKKEDILNFLRIVTHPYKCSIKNSIGINNSDLYINWIRIDEKLLVYLSYTNKRTSIPFITDIDLVEISDNIEKDYINFINYINSLPNCLEFNLLFSKDKLTIEKEE